jgi:putative acetyltransferase
VLPAKICGTPYRSQRISAFEAAARPDAAIRKTMSERILRIGYRAKLICIEPDLEAIRELWREYWASQGLPGDFQNFEAELATLPGNYQRFLLKRIDGAPAATIALRPLTEQACEVKRLYVRPAHRGQGLARELLAGIIAEAKALGYTQIFADTLPTMQAAQALYRSEGFAETEPYSDHPTPGALYLQKHL